MAKSIHAEKEFSSRGSTKQRTEQAYISAQSGAATHYPPTPIPLRASADPQASPKFVPAILVPIQRAKT